jgi:hypothetical protein
MKILKTFGALVALNQLASAQENGPPYNCRSREVWNKEKAEWCGLTYVPKKPTYNCRTREKFSPEKQAYCDKQASSDRNSDSIIENLNCNTRDSVSNWSDKKKAYCCFQSGKGCPEKKETSIEFFTIAPYTVRCFSIVEMECMQVTA